MNTAGAGAWSAFTDVVTPTKFVPPPVDPVLSSRLTAPVVAVGHRAAVTGTVAPFQGVTVTLSREVNGVFRDVTSTTFGPSATSGSFRFPLSTTASGFRAYKVTVSGPSVNTTAGSALELRVFRADVVKVSPKGLESVTLENTGKVDTEIGGWRLRDRVGKVLVLPGFNLGVGDRVRIFTGKGHPAAHRLFLGKAVDMWHPRHDTVHLYDGRGSPIASLRY
jgi:hypothetical protein